MTNPAYEATNIDVANLINEAKRSSFVMEYISNFQPEDIDSDDVDLRFEVDGIDTGCDVSIVDQCSKAATLIDALIAALEQVKQNHRLHAARLINERASLKERIAELESRPLCVKSNDAMREVAPQCVKSPEDFPDDAELLIEIEFLDDVSVDIKTAQWLKELRRRRAGTVEG